MKERVCKNCGGRRYAVVGQNMVKCMFCGTLYVDEQSSKEEDFLIVAAYEKLRAFKFETAVKEFEKILTLYPLSYEAHFGKALAKHKIIVYNNKRGARKYPRFFGEVCSLEDDSDFQYAMKNSPPETLAEYNEIEKRIEKICENYKNLDKKEKYDVVLCATEYSKNNEDERVDRAIAELESLGYKTYFVNDVKEREETTFHALSTSNALVLISNSKKEFFDPEHKHVFDRYSYFINQRKKYSKSFIIALNDLTENNLPDDLKFCKSFVDLNATSFLQDITSKVDKTIKDGVKEVAKIETIDVKKVTPDKKEYFNIDDAINPVELGHYEVENMETSEANRIRWIFLCLKNSDFQTAKKVINEELAKDENSAELLFADMLCDKKVHTAGEFFQSIGNFSDKDRIDKILKYASKDLAEMIIDNWEKLIISLDSEEYYNAFLLYLAQYTSPMRDEFIKKAEDKAIETQSQELIDKVLRCFRKDEVDRFAEFYFMLAQYSGNQEYYQKVLEIDMGHEQSNFAMLLSHFKTNEDKLNYRDREEVEKSLKFLDEPTRVQFVNAVVNMALPLAFMDTEKVQKQIDFYLAYITDKEKLVEILKVIIEKLEEMGFFKIAEKYISIAIIKTEAKAELYWMLIKAKAHCKSDAELIASNVDVAQMAEWGTLLNLANEEQTEKYAAIISKAHLYSGEKVSIRPETIDKKELKTKLTDFLNRNNRILLDMQKTDEKTYLRGINYFKLQLAPFENYLQNLDSISTFDDYKSLFVRIFERLELLDLSLESSISVIALTEKSGGLKGVSGDTVDRRIKKKREEKTYIDRMEKRSHWRFWRSLLFWLLEIVPSVMGIVFLTFISVNAKLVLKYFSDRVVLGVLLYNIMVGIISLILYCVLKKKMTRKWKAACIVLMCLSVVNLAMFVVDFYFLKTKIGVASAKDLQTYMKNSNYYEIVLEEDIDLEGKKWKLSNFGGTLNGNGHCLVGVKLVGDKGEYSLLKTNSGIIRNLIILLEDATYNNVKMFGGIALYNTGRIENCSISGNIEINTDQNALIGGFVSKNEGEMIKNVGAADFRLNISKNKTTFGGAVAVALEKSKIEKNITNNTNFVSISNNASLVMGGLVGIAENGDSISIERNQSVVNFNLDGSADEVIVGAMIGQAFVGAENNYSKGNITNETSKQTKGVLSGLFGEYLNGEIKKRINHCYSDVSISDTEGFVVAGVVGETRGNVLNCYTTKDIEVIGIDNTNGYVSVNTCEKNINGYKLIFGFDNKIWDIDENDLTKLPTLK